MTQNRDQSSWLTSLFSTWPVWTKGLELHLMPFPIATCCTLNQVQYATSHKGRVRLGLIRNKNNWNNASKRCLGAILIPEYLDFHSGYSAPRSRKAGIYSYSGISQTNVP